MFVLALVIMCKILRYVVAIFDRAIERPEQSSRSMSEETVSSELEEEPQKVFTHTVTSWSNGFTVDDSSLKTLDDPENATFLEVTNSIPSCHFQVVLHTT